MHLGIDADEVFGEERADSELSHWYAGEFEAGFVEKGVWTERAGAGCVVERDGGHCFVLVLLHLELILVVFLDSSYTEPNDFLSLSVKKLMLGAEIFYLVQVFNVRKGFIIEAEWVNETLYTCRTIERPNYFISHHNTKITNILARRTA